MWQQFNVGLLIGQEFKFFKCFPFSIVSIGLLRIGFHVKFMYDYSTKLYKTIALNYVGL